MIRRKDLTQIRNGQYKVQVSQEVFKLKSGTVYPYANLEFSFITPIVTIISCNETEW